VKLNHLIERFTACIDFQKFDKRSNKWISIDCPEKIAATYLERLGTWRLRTLTGIVNAPTLRPDGSILDQPGYDPATGILYNPMKVSFAAIPESPTQADGRAALAELKSLISEFPFVDNASRSVALSGILTTAIRRSIPRAPLHAFTAPVMGAGKSKLVNLASMAATGHEAPVIASGKTQEEMEKRLGAALIAGDAVISIDNVEHPLGGELLCQAITETTLNIRVLGKSTNVTVPNNAAFFATGNNLTIVGDMTRRALLCSLDPQRERPELREFASEDPIDTARRNRPRYVLAALTALRAFQFADRPSQAVPLGSFETWSRWVRDALIWLGEADPCETMERIRIADPKLAALTNILHQWDLVIGEQRVSASQVIDIATFLREGFEPTGRKFLNAELREALLLVAGDAGAINSKRLGRWLSLNKDRIAADKRIIADGMLDGIARWRLIRNSRP
jgi:putative DNA primase/helicase